MADDPPDAPLDDAKIADLAPEQVKEAVRRAREGL